MIAVEVLVFVAGLALVLATALSAIRTVVLPRGEPSILTRLLFTNMRKVFDARAKLARTYEARDRVMALYAPLSLVLLPGLWVALVILGFAAMFWALGAPTVRTALEYSGSSVTTLGFLEPLDAPSRLLSVVEAVIGLGLVALLISYLPSIYASYQRRELHVALLEVRAGEPPSAVTFITRHQLIGSMDRMAPLFLDWQSWFADIEETHTSLAALCFFRSPLAGRSWVTAAGAVLDSASLVTAAVRTDPMPEGPLCIRAGYLSLRRIADAFGIPHDPNPDPDGPISIDRSEFDEALDALDQIGVPLVADRDQAWRDFKGWRVNYDQVLITLAGLVMAPYAPWSSDRSLRFRVRSVGRPRRPRPA